MAELLAPDPPDFRAAARRLGVRALDALFPPQCLRCRALVEKLGALCPDCWAEVTFLVAPHCHACGLPFAHELDPGALCGRCVREPPAFGRARSVLVYDDASRDLVLGFKYADATHGAGAFGRWMARAGAELLAEADLLVPVPLHWMRLFRRRFNQAALLAHGVRAETGVPVAARALVRRRRTPPLGRLGRDARRRRLAGALAAGPEAAAVRDKGVVLVDDVMTTGETADLCARLLRRAGARHVDVLTLARAVRADN